MNLGKEEQSVEILKHIQNEHLIFDGAMGTMLQKSGLEIGGIPDLLSLTNPKLIQSIHREYVEAGCDCITTNTFGANRLKIKDTDIATLVTAAVENAKAANPKYVALDIGPIGQLMAPLGTLSFEEAYDIFKEQLVAGEKAGADLVIFETFSDLMELKVGILAAKENTKLPVFATMTYQDNGRTFVGVDPVSSTISLQGLGVDALGVNCSLGPDELIPVVETILEYATVPVMVQANAGLPDMQGNYRYSSEEYSERMLDMAKLGVRVLGGCCGTTPEFIEKTKDKVKSLKPVKTSPKRVTAVCSASSTVILDGGVYLIGERINPTGKPKLKEALKKEDYDYILNEAITQADLGADILDVNVGLPEIDEPKLLKKAVMELQSGISQPLQIDSTDAKAVEEAVRVYKGKPLINSVNGEEESMKAIFPIAKKYGACVLGLCLDKNGIPETAEGRFEIAQRILDTALSYGIPKEDILIDCLVLTASAQQEQVVTTLEAIKLVKSRLGLKCVLGVSNVSFGLPNRPLLNSVFLAAAFGAGLDAPIINPCSKEIMDTVNAFKVLNNQDKGGSDFIAKYGGSTQAPQSSTPSDNGSLDLKDVIIKGLKEQAAPLVEEMLKTKDAMEIINGYFIPALDEVGRAYETGKIFLPQLMLSAETVQNGFAVISRANTESDVKREKVVVATVEGDIHDIGKNIVKMLLSNYGYEVIDLGKDVPVEEVVEAVKKYQPSIVGLSALMTTTVKNMQRTIDALKENNLNCKTMVGGAVLNEDYAQMVGADYYAKDANTSVKVAEKVFDEE